MQLGELAKAKAEFELYLKLYPDAPGAARVRQRLATLTAMPEESPAATIRREAPSYWGSVSQYYYGGQSRTQTTTTITTPATGATTIDTARLSGTDQSQLITNVDLTARFRDATWDNRVVVRDSYRGELPEIWQQLRLQRWHCSWNQNIFVTTRVCALG